MERTAKLALPPGMPSPVSWGDEDTVRGRLRNGIKHLKLTRRTYPLFGYPFAVPDVVQFFRQNYGPIHRAFAALDAAGQDALRKDLEEVFWAFNRATDGTTSLEAEYLKVVAIRQGM